MALTTDLAMFFALVCLFVLILPSSQDSPIENPTRPCCEECVVTKTLYKKIYRYRENKDCGKLFTSKKVAEVAVCGEWWREEKCVKYRTVFKEITPFKCVSETISKTFFTCDHQCKCKVETIW